MKTYIRSIIPFIVIFLIIIACGNTNKNEHAKSVQKEETVTTQKDKGVTKSDNSLDNKKTDSAPKKKKNKKKTTDNFSDNSNPRIEKPITPKIETYKPKYRIGAICCDGTRSAATGRGLVPITVEFVNGCIPNDRMNKH